MTRRSPLYGLLALALAACAPAQTASAPSPRPAPGPAPAPAPAEQVLTSAPENWWQLDEETQGVRGISAERAHRELLAGKQPRRSVVVAIIDSGIDIEHPDLDDVLWVNSDEVAGNGRDDDRNGYVDDVHGWNFIGGPGGKQVDKDTYELTRLYAQYRARFANANPSTLSAAQRAEYEKFQQYKRELDEKRAEAEEYLSNIRRLQSAFSHFSNLLKLSLGVDSLTAERVSALQTTRPELLQAKAAWLELNAAGISAKALEDAIKDSEGRLQYGLNPDFNPRPLVGDNYADPRERGYGNALVEGPDATHGTHVAGIVAAERGNGIGIDGVAPSARIMVLRAVPDGDERDKDVANAIRYAADNGAQIVNMSFGKAYSPEKEVVDEAVRYALAKGVLFVHAAGNDASDIDVTPSYPTRRFLRDGNAGAWIEVGASSWKPAEGLAADFSNYSRAEVDVFAPGVAIRSTVPGGGYEDLQGTSMAAPVVTGVAATLMAFYPELTAEQVKQIILESATRYPTLRVVRPGTKDERVGFAELSSTGAVVNLYRALQLAEQRTK